jgi:hypothetical protein
MLVAVHAKTDNMLVTLEKSLETKAPSMIAIVEHWGYMTYQKDFAILALHILEQIGKPLKLVSRIISTLDYVKVV